MIINYQIKNEQLTNRYHLIDSIIMFLYCTYFILSPFYLWRSGIPQIADLILILTFILYFTKNKFTLYIHNSTKRILFIGLLFVLWVVFVNLMWFASFSKEQSFLLTNLYYIYNFIVLFFSIMIINEYRFNLLYKLFKFQFISLFVQLFIGVINGFSQGRFSGTFNNPNQLGYYVLLMVGFLFYYADKTNIKSRNIIIGLLFSFALILTSLSNAAIIAWFFMFFFFILSNTESKKIKKRIIIFSITLIILFFIIYFNTDYIQNSNLYQGIINRLGSTQNQIENISEVRGYYRITNYPQYWLFGAGEGLYSRFGSNLEFHSILGNIQVSYGIIGTLLFITILYYILKKNNFRYWYIVASILLYGLAHNGIRNTLFWILLSVLIIKIDDNVNN